MISQAKNPIKREDGDLSVFKKNRHLRGATFVACAPFVAPSSWPPSSWPAGVPSPPGPFWTLENFRSGRSADPVETLAGRAFLIVTNETIRQGDCSRRAEHSVLCGFLARAVGLQLSI